MSLTHEERSRLRVNSQVLLYRDCFPDSRVQGCFQDATSGLSDCRGLSASNVDLSRRSSLIG